MKSIKVPAMRLQAGNLHVNGMPQLRQCQCAAGSDDFAELFIVGHFPVDADRNGRHSAAGEWFRSQSRPQDNAVRLRIAGGDSQGERITVEPDIRGAGFTRVVRSCRDCRDR